MVKSQNLSLHTKMLRRSMSNKWIRKSGKSSKNKRKNNLSRKWKRKWTQMTSRKTKWRLYFNMLNIMPISYYLIIKDQRKITWWLRAKEEGDSRTKKKKKDILLKNKRMMVKAIHISRNSLLFLKEVNLSIIN